MARHRLLATVVCAAFVLAACGSNNKVGSGVDLSVKGQLNQQRLGQTTTTVPVATTAPANRSLGVGQSSTTTTRPVVASTTSTTAQQFALDISINSDGGSTTQFDPSAGRVFKDSLVKWTNKDKVARSIEADAGAFNSGPIQPGSSFVYKASSVGSFNYHDGTRPYAVGTLEVVAR